MPQLSRQEIMIIISHDYLLIFLRNTTSMAFNKHENITTPMISNFSTFLWDQVMINMMRGRVTGELLSTT